MVSLPPKPPPEKQDSRLMRRLFGTVAPRYDFITRAFSFGMDRGWKRVAVLEAALPRGAVVLDLACGTADFAKLVLERDATCKTVAADLTFEMLALSQAPRPVCADAMRLPFADQAFDGVFAGYGLRNFPELAGAIGEIRRVLRPGGVLVTLDFFLPTGTLFRPLYLSYLYAQGAFWGMVLHGKLGVYTYIPDSLRTFCTADGLSRTLHREGFSPVRYRTFIGGGIAVHWATMPTMEVS